MTILPLVLTIRNPFFFQMYSVACSWLYSPCTWYGAGRCLTRALQISIPNYTHFLVFLQITNWSCTQITPTLHCPESWSFWEDTATYERLKKMYYDGESWWLCMSSFPFIGLSKCAKQPVHENGVVTIVVAVGGMMDCVKSSPHYTPHPPIDTVVDVGCPNSFHKKHNLMCEKMRRDEEQCHHMRRCLEDAIQWMKGQTCPQNVQLPLLRTHFVTDSEDTC